MTLDTNKLNAAAEEAKAKTTNKRWINAIKEPTAEELKLAGVTLVGTDSSLAYMLCDSCQMQWAAPLRAAPLSWICPNARNVPDVEQPDEQPLVSDELIDGAFAEIRRIMATKPDGADKSLAK